MEYGLLSLIPPILAVFLAFVTKQVVISLLIGIFAGSLIITEQKSVHGLQARCTL